MSTEEARKGLESVKEYISENMNDRPVQRAYCLIAIDTAILELNNYERLLEETLTEAKNKILAIEHDLSIRSLCFKIYKEGGLD